MLKLGITRAKSLPRVTTLLGRRRRIAFRVYAEILRDRPESDVHLPLVLEGLIVGRHAFKRTYDRRFSELDGVIFEAVRSLGPVSQGPLRVHDMGVSDARTSAELLRRLEALGPVDFTASDWYGIVHQVRNARAGWSVCFDDDLQPVEYTGWGFVLSPSDPDHRLAYPVNRMVRWLFETRLLPIARAQLEGVRRDALPDLDELESGDFRILRIPLVCREFRERMRTSGSCRFVRHDVRTPTPDRYHLIRVMNVLNHLEPEEQRRSLEGLRASLEEGGLLVVGRSLDRFDETGGESASTIWVRRGAGFERWMDVGGGSELEPLASALEAPHATQLA